MLEVGLVLLVLFPLPVMLWQLGASLGWFSSTSLAGLLFQGWDAGGQHPFSRALLRSLGAGTILSALVLPRRTDWAPPGWFRYGLFFLCLGAVSSVLAPHRFQALREWETWLLAGLLVYVVGAYWRTRWNKLCLGLSYFLAWLVVVQAVLIGLPVSQGRLGGFFHHPNALSTLSLMLLAVMLSRALSESSDAIWARCLSGGLLAVVICTGSLTGGVLLVGVSAWLSSVGRPYLVRLAGGVAAGACLLLVNLWGQEWSMLCLPGLLITFWLFAMSQGANRKWVAVGVTIVSVATAVLALQAFWTPAEGISQGHLSRLSSGLGRLQFYRSCLAMLWENPWFGVGPAGFSRTYPGIQVELDYFSKFPHSLPLEVLSEWGVPAAVALLLMLYGAIKPSQSDCKQQIAGWVLLVFLLHSSTDVQTQFPYLLLLAAIALGVIAAGHRPQDPGVGEGPSQMGVRIALVLSCAVLLSVNLARMNAGFDRSLALSLARSSRAMEEQALIEELLAKSFLADPLDSESARLWGLALLSSNQKSAARDIASLALWLDPNRATCELLALSAEPPPDDQAVERYRRVLELDRVNYPIFYRKLAEALWTQGRWQEARMLLRGQASVYRSDRLAKLFRFREKDLQEQLVEFFALKAMLEEKGAPGAGEPDFRRALQHTGGRAEHLERLELYLEKSPFLASIGQAEGAKWFELFRKQIPATRLPGSVTGPLHQSQDLEFSESTGGFHR